MMESILGESPYQSPTDMGVNMVGNCICDDEVCSNAARNEVVRRYFHAREQLARTGVGKDEVAKLELPCRMSALTPIFPRSSSCA